MKKRVVITGLGMISGLGKNVTESWENVASGHSAIRPIEGLDLQSLRIKNGSQVPGYDPLLHFKEKELEYIDKFAQFTLIAAREAIDDAGLIFTEENKPRSAVITGTGIGGQDTQETSFTDLYLKGKTKTPIFTIPRIMPNAGASLVTMEFGITGPAYTISTACASSNHAIGNAFMLVRSGMVDIALTGGSETPFSFGYIKAWEPIRVVAEDTCRPFSKFRQGMILGEGAAMLVLESLDSALQRNARIYAEVIGFGMTSDAGHITKPNGAGAETAMRLAMSDGNIEPSDINYINAHGTGTLINDVMEVTAVKNVFGDHANKIALSSTKSLHGHILGGTSAVEAVITSLALHHQVFPPTANFIEKDPECDVDCVPNQSRKGEINYALSNSFAFGGLNAVLAFKRY